MKPSILFVCAFQILAFFSAAIKAEEVPTGTTVNAPAGVKEIGAVSNDDAKKAANVPASPAGGQWIDHPLGIGFQLPEGFKKLSEDTTNITYIGPSLGGIVLSINILKITLPGVAKEILYQGNATSYQNTATYQNFKEITTIPNAIGFQAEEINKAKPNDLHRRIIMIWIPDTQFNVILSGSMSGVQSSQAMFDQFIASLKPKT